MTSVLLYIPLTTLTLTLTHHSKKLLDVMLHEGVEGFPPEALGQLLGADWLVRELQFVEDPLQRQRHTLTAVVTLRRHLVHSLATDQNLPTSP